MKHNLFFFFYKFHSLMFFFLFLFFSASAGFCVGNEISPTGSISNDTFNLMLSLSECTLNDLEDVTKIQTIVHELKKQPQQQLVLDEKNLLQIMETLEKISTTLEKILEKNTPDVQKPDSFLVALSKEALLAAFKTLVNFFGNSRP